MVVAGLQSYCEKIPGALYSANLRELIEEELSRREGRATLVLDDSSSRNLYEGNRCQLFNGRPKINKSRIEKFVENLISCGINLIVVLRGENEYHVNFSHTLSKTKVELDKFFVEGIFSEDFLKTMAPITTFCDKTTFSSIKNEHYTVFASYGLTYKDVAQIATEQNCLAVIGQDSNYLIYEGIRYYILMSSINPETLDCYIYDRDKLMEHLGLRSYQLPLFATLCGNNIVSSTDLQKFHKTISANHESKFLAIAEKVRRTSDSPYDHVKEMVQLINHPNVDENLISESLHMYLNYHQKSVPTNKWEAFANERVRMKEWSLTPRRILLTKKYRNYELTGFFLPDSIPAVELLRPLRKKIYGVLLYDDEDNFIKEYCCEEYLRSGSKYPRPNFVFAEKPKCPHPGLVQLWNKNTPHLDVLKWGLFSSSLGETLSLHILRTLPRVLLFPALALHYLHFYLPSYHGRKVFREKFEIEAFVVVALLVMENLEESLLENHLEVLDRRLWYLSSCFISTCYTLKLLNEVCGLVVRPEEVCICNFYDGTLLHYVYERMSKGEEWSSFFEGRLALEAMFCTLMEIIQGNKTDVD